VEQTGIDLGRELSTSPDEQEFAIRQYSRRASPKTRKAMAAHHEVGKLVGARLREQIAVDPPAVNSIECLEGSSSRLVPALDRAAFGCSSLAASVSVYSHHCQMARGSDNGPKKVGGEW
jgi:hypothetical protein